MEIRATKLEGVKFLSPKIQGDHRGYLVRTYCEKTFCEAGLNIQWRQSSMTATPIQGTLRGMHFQEHPFEEIKLIRCISGAVWDCLVDIRKDSPTFGLWESFELSEQNGAALYLPIGIAHGFYTLTNDVRMLYSMSAEYSAEHAKGIRWDDSSLSIKWPGQPKIISDRDREWPSLSRL